MFHCFVLQPNNAGQWGDNANQQWSATVGKSRPNPQQNPANWGGVDDLNWNTPPVCTDIVSFLFVYMFLLLAATLHWICFEKNLFCVLLMEKELQGSHSSIFHCYMYILNEHSEIRLPDKCFIKNYFSYFLSKTCCWDQRKGCLRIKLIFKLLDEKINDFLHTKHLLIWISVNNLLR